MTSRPVRSFLLAGVVLSFILLGCDRDGGSGRVIVLALDGLDPRAVDLLMSEGKLPNLAKMRQYGAYGRLESRKPLLSPVVWTTIATGKTPDQHRIGHFVAIDERTGESFPVTSEMRRVKAVWNIFSEADKSVAVVGWWATWPPEEVKGAIVSDHTCYHFLFPQGGAGASENEVLTHPPTLFSRIAPLVRRPDDVTAEEASGFIDVGAEELSRPFDFDDDVSHFKWALATADSYRRIGLELWREERPDLLMVYTEGTDSVSHLFGHLFRTETLSGELRAQQQKFGNAVEKMYLYADRLVGEYMDAMDADTTLVVLSDHGFDLGAAHYDPSKTRDLRRVSERFHREEGILYLYGRGVVRGRLQEPTILDVAPTLLALSGLAPAVDMPGRVLTEGLDITVTAARVASYESDDAREPAPAARESASSPEILERLESLGYIDGSGPRFTSPEGERNLASVLFEAGRYEESAEAYARLVQQSPDDASLRTSLAGALGALGRYDEAVEHLDVATELDPLNVEAYHNRGAVYEQQERREEAIEQYRTALRYQPQYEPARRALVRLAGSAEAYVPRSESEERAFALAERASRAARQGDYENAMELLSEAQAIAPDYSLVYQYQSNVAYLMGDVPRAIEALRRALELEPDNALYRTNLERLEAQQTRR